LQAVINPRSNVTSSGIHSVANVTGDWVKGRIQLPYYYTTGTPIYLGGPDEGYPKELDPNLTYVDGPTNVSRVEFEDDTVHYNSILFLGPLYLNNSSSLISITVAINNNTSREDILGWLTVVLDARLLYNVMSSPEGLGSTGEVLLIGPITEDNLFKQDVEGASAADNADVDVWYVLPPPNDMALGYRHDFELLEQAIQIFLSRWLPIPQSSMHGRKSTTSSTMLVLKFQLITKRIREYQPALLKSITSGSIGS
jgi:osomolarity two-component system, sensor histidine kinase SLN1